METHAQLMLAEARAGLLARGSIREFLLDPVASLNVVTMYVAARLSIELDVTLVRAEAHDEVRPRQQRSLRGVHLTDGTSTIVMVTRSAHVTYDECAPFLLSDIGFVDGVLASPWRKIIIVRDARSTLCAELRPIMVTYAIDRLIHTTELEFCLSMLVGAHPIAAVPNEPNQEGASDESDESDEDAQVQAQVPDQAQEQELGAGAALDQIDVDGLDLDEIQFENVVTLIERHVAQYGGLPTQNGPRYCALGRRVQFFRTSYRRMLPERVARLERVPGWSWRPHDDTFLARRQEFIEYAEHIARHPEGPLPPRYTRVPKWIVYNRRRYVRDELKQERIDSLNATPGWSWE